MKQPSLDAPHAHRLSSDDLEFLKSLDPEVLECYVESQRQNDRLQQVLDDLIHRNRQASAFVWVMAFVSGIEAFNRFFFQNAVISMLVFVVFFAGFVFSCSLAIRSRRSLVAQGNDAAMRKRKNEYKLKDQSGS